MQGLHDTRLAAEAEYYINYIRKGMERKESLYYKGNNSYSFVTEVNIYHFKAKDSEWLDYHCVWEIFQKIFQMIIWSKHD